MRTRTLTPFTVVFVGICLTFYDMKTMCFPSNLQKKHTSPTMADKKRVAVFDPDSCDFRKLPLQKLKGLSIHYSRITQLILSSFLASDYDKVEIPRFKRRFDVWAPSSLDLKDQCRPSHSIVTRDTDDVKGKSFVARVYYGQLGMSSSVQRLVSSKSSKNRTLYIGAMPN